MSKILKKQLKNNKLNLPSILGMNLLNSNGDVDTSSAGFRYIIDTLSAIRSKVIQQKFYEVAIADYIPVDIGEAAWADEIVQNLQYSFGGGFYEGDVSTSNGNGKIPEVGAALSPVRMPVKTWLKGTSWTIIEIAKAAAASKWDVVSAKLESLKKNWDLGIQETAFLGHPSDTLLTGLVNNSEVNINTTLIAEKLSNMTGAEFTVFVANVLAAYFTNSNDTAMPDTFVIPTDDYLGLVAPYSETYPMISKISYLLDAFKKATQNEGFKIMPLAYCQATRNNSLRALNKDRYILYKNNADSLAMAIPVDLTMLEADTSNKMHWTQGGYGQYSGVLFNRVREALYIDKTPAGTQ